MFGDVLHTKPKEKETSTWEEPEKEKQRWRETTTTTRKMFTSCLKVKKYIIKKQNIVSVSTPCGDVRWDWEKEEKVRHVFCCEEKKRNSQERKETDKRKQCYFYGHSFFFSFSLLLSATNFMAHPVVACKCKALGLHIMDVLRREQNHVCESQIKKEHRNFAGEHRFSRFRLVSFF